jgi:hypothetical protein
MRFVIIGGDAAPRVVDTDAMGNSAPGLDGPVGLEVAKAVEQLAWPHGMAGGSRYELRLLTGFCDLSVVRHGSGSRWCSSEPRSPFVDLDTLSQLAKY